MRAASRPWRFDLRGDLRARALSACPRALGELHRPHRADRESDHPHGRLPHGQGQETSFAQIAADELGCDISDVTVIHGDTSIVQYGIGTFGSRATAVGGTAVHIAIEKLKEKAHRIAAHMLGADAANLSFAEGNFAEKLRRRPRSRGSPNHLP